MPKIKVYAKMPVAHHALLAHPIDGVLRETGSDWEDDVWTYRLLQEGAITTDKADAWDVSKKPVPAAETAEAQVVMHDLQQASHPVGISQPPKK